MADQYRILIVEDDALIAMELEERLVEQGYEVIGPAMTIEAAERAVAGTMPDAALLDADVAGRSSVKLGAMLAAQGVPVAFCTGYNEVKNLPPELADVMVLTKPITDADLTAALKKLVASLA